MRLTGFSDYTLRVLIYLGLNPDRLITIDEIATAYDISRNHLMKIVHHQAKRGTIVTVRGKGGGMRLGLTPEQINVGRLVRETEQNMALVECFNPARSGCCKIESVCVLRGALNRATEAFYDVLEQYCLADLIAPQRQLCQLLGIDDPNVVVCER
jgi:Rrf2 family nitric oxide-sensitive transcriptional repressor|tara:strand:- start:1070 stop:1534 length:465 start_codon:yes stop_codon:yes gene_type:complete